VVRLLAGGKTRSVRAHAGAWDASRATQGAYTAQLTFDNGAFASLTYSGYAHFDSDELQGWIGELGHARDTSKYGAARAALRGLTPTQEVALKAERVYGAAETPVPAPIAHNHFGMVIVSCDRADLRPMPNGVMIYEDSDVRLDALPAPVVPRAEVIDEFCDAVAGTRAATHTGEWAMATLEVCLGIIESARSGRELRLGHD